MNSPPNSSPSRQLPRVLIAEDHDTDFLLLSRHIKKHWPGCESARAGSRTELVSVLAQSWDLIITDYHLLDIQEHELLALIADAQPQTRCILWSGSMYELIDTDLPSNIVCKLEKGDYAGLSQALASSWP